MNKEYNVLILGPKGSGKTVYLSSMYYQLCMPDEYNFFIETESHQQGKLLKAMYSNLPTGWPDPTQADKIHEWKFRCMLRSGDQLHEAFRINYFDYSGGRLTDDTDDNDEMKKVINKAHITLGMIDGSLLSKAMKANTFTSSFYLTYLESVLQYLSIAHTENQIVHLLITKWDLLKDKFTVSEIKERLLEFDRFRKFAQGVVYNGSVGGKIRLIPVSSVGFDFAELAEDGVNMKIKSSGHLRPYNVEIPLSLALIDPIRKSIEEMAAKERELQNTSINVEPNLEWWEWLLRGLGEGVKVVSQRLGVSIPVLNRLADLAASVGDESILEAEQKEQRLREELKNRINKVYNAQEAADFALTSFLANEKLLIREHPGSLIDKSIFEKSSA